MKLVARVVGRRGAGLRARRVRGETRPRRRRRPAVPAVREAGGLRRQHGHRRAALVATPAALSRQVAAKLLRVRQAARRGVHRRPRVHGARLRPAPDAAQPPVALTPLEFLFPPGPHFKTYDLKITQFHPECNVPCTRAGPGRRASRQPPSRCSPGFSGEGYARMDFRVDAGRPDLLPRGELHLLGVLPRGLPGFGRLHPRRSTGWARRGSCAPSSTRASHATRAGSSPTSVRPQRRRLRPCSPRATSRAASVVFEGEGRAQRIVTRSHVERTWPEADRDVFYRYAYPIGPEVFVLWDTEPTGWAPQNHSCDPNTAFAGLNVVALRDIRERRRTDGRLRDVLRRPHDAVRLRRAAARTAAGGSRAGRGCSGRRWGLGARR